jgi:DnaJ-class molecular chaperone
MNRQVLMVAACSIASQATTSLASSSLSNSNQSGTIPFHLTKSPISPSSFANIDPNVTNIRGGSHNESSKNKKDDKEGGPSKKKIHKSSSNNTTKKKKKHYKESPHLSSSASSTRDKPQKEISEQSTATPPSKSSSPDHITSILESSCLYEILGLDASQKSSITAIQIKKAYRKRAVQTHPDKNNGDRRAFDKVSEAHDILYDENKKKIYDKYGIDVVRDPDLAARASMGGLGSSLQEQLFKSFFGVSSSASDSFSRMSQQFRAKNHNLKYELEVSLEEMYYGITDKTVTISTPNGPKTVKVDIPSGTVSGSSIVLSGVLDSVQNATPGDIIFIVRQKQHKMFTRRGHDLAMELRISLSEAICGFQKEIQLLDGRIVRISSPCEMSMHLEEDSESPTVICTGDVHVLKGYGMPKRRLSTSAYHQNRDNIDDADRADQFGDLYIQYTVIMPNENKQNHIDMLTNEERKTLGELLDKLQGLSPEKIESSNEEIVRLHKALASDFGRASGTAEPHHDTGDGHFPSEHSFSFGDQGGYQHFSFSKGGARQFFSRGTSPFSRFYEDSEEVQCQQM